VDVTLIDRRNFHLFQPLLYQVATGGLSPANIATPFRWSLRRHRNTDIVLDEVIGFDVPGRRVRTSSGSIDYDHLIVATGATHSYFGNDWEARAPGLKTVEDALEIRRRVLLAFERADREPDPRKRSALLTFVIVGAGPTGVELAGALGEISEHTLRHDYRHIDPRDARILIVDALDRVLSAYPEDLSARAAGYLEQLGVSAVMKTRVTGIHEDEVVFETDGEIRTVACATTLWAAGVEASPLGRQLAEQTGCAVDRAGRLEIGPDLTLPGHAEISVIGDLASFRHGLERALPGVAPVALQQGHYVARRIRRGLTGLGTPPFRYRDRGSLATIGRARAVAQLGRHHVSGFVAWLLWLVVHVMSLARAENRVLVFVQWAWSYVTYDRSARLITNDRGREAGMSSAAGDRSK
jgi:NADH dehydrogenase